MLQGKVFGAGYPSAPTVTLEEFFDQQYKKMMEEQRWRYCFCTEIRTVCSTHPFNLQVITDPDCIC
jgi:hypothetical protein